MNFKSLKKKIREPKVSRLLPNICDFQKENLTLGYGFKNLSKIYSRAYGFSYFEISISERIYSLNQHPDFNFVVESKHV